MNLIFCYILVDQEKLVYDNKVLKDISFIKDFKILDKKYYLVNIKYYNIDYLFYYPCDVYYNPKK